MSNVTVEVINDFKCTIVRRDFNYDTDSALLDRGIPLILEYHDGRCRVAYELSHWIIDNWKSTTKGYPKYVKTILPAVPRYPTNEEINNYAAHGISILIERSTHNPNFTGVKHKPEIHGAEYCGEEVIIALDGAEAYEHSRFNRSTE